MLEDWERRQLASIEEELRSDLKLARLLAPPSRRDRRWLALRRHFYPHGFLLCVVVYMLCALDGAFVLMVAKAAAVGIAVGLLVALSADGGWQYLRRVSAKCWDR